MPITLTPRAPGAPNPAATLEALEAASVAFGRGLYALRFEIGPRRGLIESKHFSEATAALRAHDAAAAQQKLTTAAGLPSRLLELDTLAQFVRDLLPLLESVPRGQHVLIGKVELKALRLAGTDGVYGGPGATPVTLETRVPLTKAPSVPKAQKQGIALGLKSGRISRAFNARSSDRAREATLRGQMQRHYDQIARAVEGAPKLTEVAAACAAVIAAEDFVALNASEAWPQALQQLPERELREGLFAALGRWRPKIPEAVRGALADALTRSIDSAQPGVLGSQSDGPPAEVWRTLVELLTKAVAQPQDTTDAWESTAADAELQACLALATPSETRDAIYCACWRAQPDAPRSARIERAKDLAARLDNALGVGLAKRLHVETVRAYGDAGKALRAAAERPLLLRERLAKLGAQEGPFGVVLARALDAGDGHQLRPVEELRERFGTLGQRLDTEAARLGTLTPEALRAEVRALPEVLERLRRALAADSESSLGDAAARFYAPAAGTPGAWVGLADPVVACAVLGLGGFGDIPAEVTFACGVLSATATTLMLLNEAGVRVRLMGT